MELSVGTSGYQYKAWRGSFYPERCKEADMLGHYAQQLPTVEVNNTFYRMPRPQVLERWAQQVPPEFVFAVKASRRITHVKRLKDPEETLGYLFDALTCLGPKLGPVLFQLPPTFRKDVARLDGLLARVPQGVQVALEFRNPSWFDEEVYARLRQAGACLCIADVEGTEPDWVTTADVGYLRLRRDDYSDADLDRLAERIAAQPWERAYAYFKHEDVGPGLAAKLSQRFVGG